jgi:hypothetical protein
LIFEGQEPFPLSRKPVYDSALDDVMVLGAFSLGESVRMLNRRVNGFPGPLAFFCHVWACGRPRDVIRCARLAIRTAVRSGETDLKKIAATLADADPDTTEEPLASLLVAVKCQAEAGGWWLEVDEAAERQAVGLIDKLRNVAGLSSARLWSAPGQPQWHREGRW